MTSREQARKQAQKLAAETPGTQLYVVKLSSGYEVVSFKEFLALRASNPGLEPDYAAYEARGQ